jgi:hypothetical protein
MKRVHKTEVYEKADALASSFLHLSPMHLSTILLILHVPFRLLILARWLLWQKHSQRLISCSLYAQILQNVANWAHCKTNFKQTHCLHNAHFSCFPANTPMLLTVLTAVSTQCSTWNTGKARYWSHLAWYKLINSFFICTKH